MVKRILFTQAFDASLSVVLMKSQLEALESKTGVQVGMML